MRLCRHHRLPDGLGFIFDARQLDLRKRALRLPHVALRSVFTNGFVAAAAPPHSHELFAHAQAESLTAEGVFAIQHLRAGGPILSHGLGAYLNLCQVTNPSSTDATQLSSPKDFEAFALCAATPSVMQKHVAALPGKAHHRQILLTPRGTSSFVVERV